MISEAELKWEHSSCSFCGSVDYELIFQGPDRLHQMPGCFSLCCCKKCGIYRQEPRLSWESLSAYYPENYVAYHYSMDEAGSAFQQRIKNYGNMKRRRFVEIRQPGGRLLEVGCGTGGFLRELSKSHSWQLEGIEPTPSAADFASKTLGITIYQSRLSEAGLQPASYDAIVLWCVLEHLSQPFQDLKLIHSLLKMGGWVFFTIPNVESLEAKAFDRFWSGWDLPRHLYVFPQPVLRRFLIKLGFGNFDARCIATSYHQLAHTLDFWSQNWGKEHPLIRHLLLKGYGSILGRLGLFLPLAFLDRLNLSANITIAAQKIQ